MARTSQMRVIRVQTSSVVVRHIRKGTVIAHVYGMLHIPQPGHYLVVDGTECDVKLVTHALSEDGKHIVMVDVIPTGN